ncbi:MAG: nuclear transport factor 2 family protein [Knoellia sp.]
MGNADVARAFSGHRFEEAFDHLAADVVWVVVGGDDVHGREAAIATCRDSAAYLSTVTTTWHRVVCADAGEVVAVDVLASYAGPDGATTVSSCDIYEFTDEALTRITSYTGEVEPPA